MKRMGVEEIKRRQAEARAKLAERKAKESPISNKSPVRLRGRPRFVDEPGILTANVRKSHLLWLKEQSDKYNISMSDLVRQILDHAMSSE